MNDPKSIAQQIAKQIAQEPFEMLKSAGEQVGVVESQPEQPPENQKPKEPDEQQKQKMMLQGQRQLEALNREVKDIEKQRLIKDVQEKINNGEELNLANYPELTMEEREVLMAQMQAVKARAQMAGQGDPLIQPAAKPNRKFAGEGLGAKRQQTHVEKPLPPSG
jgi:hypothetical protein